VGFAAVVAVSDAPRVRSVTGTVGWSRDRTRELVRAVPALAGELAERSFHMPVLRLPFAEVDGRALPDGFATVVELALRDEDAEPLHTWRGSRSRMERRDIAVRRLLLVWAWAAGSAPPRVRAV
jgi:hypothetical protein